MGSTLYYTMKLPRHDSLWMLPMISDSKWHSYVREAHQSYIARGADII